MENKFAHNPACQVSSHYLTFSLVRFKAILRENARREVARWAWRESNPRLLLSLQFLNNFWRQKLYHLTTDPSFKLKKKDLNSFSACEF